MIAVQILLVVSAMLTFTRAVQGPTVAQRVVATSAIGLMLLSVLLMLSLTLDAPVFLDIALVYAMLQFVDVLVIAWHLGRAPDGRSRPTESLVPEDSAPEARR